MNEDLNENYVVDRSTYSTHLFKDLLLGDLPKYAGLMISIYGIVDKLNWLEIGIGASLYIIGGALRNFRDGIEDRENFKTLEKRLKE